MRRTGRRSPLLIAAACATVALALGACGGTEEEPRVATADSAAPRPSPSGGARTDVVAQYVAEVRKYVKCMRGEGFDLPDPGPKGELDHSALGGNFKTDPKFLAAAKKCSHLMPPVPEELGEKLEPLTPQQIRWKREYARCMRENGVPSFPDPGPDGHWTDRDDTSEIPEREADNMFRAGQICEPLIEGRPKGTPDPDAPGNG
jgi:hypothetical protein